MEEEEDLEEGEVEEKRGRVGYKESGEEEDMSSMTKLNKSSKAIVVAPMAIEPIQELQTKELQVEYYLPRQAEDPHTIISSRDHSPLVHVVNSTKESPNKKLQAIVTHSLKKEEEKEKVPKMVEDNEEVLDQRDNQTIQQPNISPKHKGGKRGKKQGNTDSSQSSGMLTRSVVNKSK